MNEWVIIGERLGVPLAMLFAVGFAMFKVTRYLGVRFFDDQTGYVTIFIAKHVIMVDDVRKGVLEVTEAAQQTTAILHAMQVSIGSSVGVIVRTNEVLRHLALAIRAIAAKEGVDISSQISEINEILSRSD